MIILVVTIITIIVIIIVIIITIVIITTIMQGEQANINIIVAWAEGALVQVRLHLFNLITLYLTTTSYASWITLGLLEGGQDDQRLLPRGDQGGHRRASSCSGVTVLQRLFKHQTAIRLRAIF